MSGARPFWAVYWVAAAMLALAGLLNLRRARGGGDALPARNRRTAGWLFLAAAAVFAVLASGALDRLL